MTKREQEYVDKYGMVDGQRKWKERAEKQKISLKERHRQKQLIDPLASAKNSPCTKHYYTERGYTEEEASEAVYLRSMEVGSKNKIHWENGKFQDRVIPSNVEYWERLGYSSEESKLMVSYSQRTFSLKICIEKYGEEEGHRRWKLRQDKWQNTLNSKPMDEQIRINLAKQNNKDSFSKVSQELFWCVYSRLKDTEKIYFAELNKEFITAVPYMKKVYMFDFMDTKIKKCIEFNGDLFHANPNIYGKDDTPNFHDRSLTSSDIWKADKIKLDFIRSIGYDVLVIWEHDYRMNKELSIQRCIHFIEDGYAN